MGFKFEPSEAFQLAIRIEENGEKFYLEMGEKLQDPSVKKLFFFLAKEEIEHRKFYEKICSELEKEVPFESYPGEYSSYLFSYAETVLFNKQILQDKIEEINDEIEAIDFAISTELNAISFFLEFKNIVSGKNRDMVDQIIEEERRHFVQLTNMKNIILKNN